MEISGRVHSDSWEVFLDSQKRRDLINIFHAISRPNQGIIHVSEAAEMLIGISKELHCLGTSFLNSMI